MKIRNVAQIAIAFLALVTPRFVESGGVFGGGIDPEPEKTCNRKHKPHPCSGPSSCGSIPTTEASTNWAELLYLDGTSTANCFTGNNHECSGSAVSPNSNCKQPMREDG